MSILIKGMKMPKSCDECWFRAGAWCAAIEDWRKAYNTPPRGERLEDCPLVELPPHGRLIDGDVAEAITLDHADGDFIDGIVCAGDCDRCGNRERAEAFKTLQTDYEVCRNELCLRCGDYKMAHKGACDDCRWRH